MNFLRKIKVRVSTIAITYPELYMEGSVEISGTANGNSGKLKIYNLSDATIRSHFDVGNRIQIYAGYDYLGLIYDGTILDYFVSWEEVNKCLEIYLDNFSKAVLNQQFLTATKEIKSSELASIVTKQLDGGSGSFVLHYDAKSDIVFNSFIMAGETCYKVLQTIADENNADFYINGKDVYIGSHLLKGTTKVIYINQNTGLIQKPELKKVNKNPNDDTMNYPETTSPLIEDSAANESFLSQTVNMAQDSLGVTGASDMGGTEDYTNTDTSNMSNFNANVEPEELITIKCLLNPEIQLDSMLKLESKSTNLSGYYVPYKIKHEFNSQSFTTEIECLPFGNREIEDKNK